MKLHAMRVNYMELRRDLAMIGGGIRLLHTIKKQANKSSFLLSIFSATQKAAVINPFSVKSKKTKIPV